MTPNTSIDPLGRNSNHLAELEEQQLQYTQLVECHEASYRPSRMPSKARSEAHGIHTAEPAQVHQGPGTIDERSRDSFLQFRDEWVRNRARDIQQSGSISFRTCSEDTASIRALNEFYRWRVFDGFKAEHRLEKETGIEMTQDSCVFGSFPKDCAAAEKLQMCRIICREKGRRVSRKTCRLRANTRV